MKNNVANKSEINTAESSLQDDFDGLTSGIQRILDLGAEALAEAEEKTAKIAKINPESDEYSAIVAQVKAAQSRAGNAFKQAEELINSTNELLLKKK
jgi:hypothetical protein